MTRVLYWMTPEKCFISTLLINPAGDSRKLFQIVNSLSKERLVEEFPNNRDPSILANEFGEFFCNKIELMKSKIDEISINQPDVPFHLPEVKLDEFSSVLLRMKFGELSLNLRMLPVSWTLFLHHWLNSVVMNWHQSSLKSLISLSLKELYPIIGK